MFISLNNVILILFTFFVVSGCNILDPDLPGNLVPKTVKEDSSLPSFQLGDGTLLHLESFGDPDLPVLIILHGGPGNDYRSYLPLSDLSDSFHVIFWDQRGAGLSQRVPESKIDDPRYLEDLHEIGLHFSPDDPFYLFGHSWGGAFATYYVKNHPQRVAKLILLEPGALSVKAAKESYETSYNITEEELNDFIMSSDYLLPSSYAVQDYFFAILLAENALVDDYASKKEIDKVPYWRNGFLANKGINEWQGNFDEPTFNVLKELEYDGPVLLIGGDKSKRLGFNFQQKYHAPHFNDVELIKLYGAGHFSQFFNADQLIPIIRNFLQK